jgi:D-tyrosyl-tRNA(Tyr) deacylase
MRAVIQRVSFASVSIDRQEKARIANGLLIFLGIEEADSREDLEWLSGKIARLRIFHDQKGIMNLSLTEVGGEAMVISQFTLHASTRKGNRPSYMQAARPPTAIPLYEQFISHLSHDIGLEVKSGEFGAYMQVEMLNDGPVTIIIDSKKRE